MTDKTNEIEAWHFLSEDKKLRYGDKREVIVGKKLVHKGEIVLCKSGFHASTKALDALGYAPGPVICRVKLSGEIKHDVDKLVASERTVLWMVDATNTLHEFGCWAAEQVLHFFEEKFSDDKRPRKAIEAKRKWIKGEISDHELGRAWDAAWAARDTARVPRTAAWAAARVAGDAARATKEKQLTQMLMELKP